MIIFRFSKSINRYLINAFEQSRLKYMFFLFPAYQFLALVGLTAIIFSFQAAEASLYLGILGAFLTIVIGIPVITSWHLSCILFAIGYFGFLASIGVPLASRITTILENQVKLFRPTQ